MVWRRAERVGANISRRAEFFSRMTQVVQAVDRRVGEAGMSVADVLDEFNELFYEKKHMVATFVLALQDRGFIQKRLRKRNGSSAEEGGGGRG